jgi:hypothetical protein
MLSTSFINNILTHLSEATVKSTDNAYDPIRKVTDPSLRPNNVPYKANKKTLTDKRFWGKNAWRNKLPQDQRDKPEKELDQTLVAKLKDTHSTPRPTSMSGNIPDSVVNVGNKPVDKNYSNGPTLLRDKGQKVIINLKPSIDLKKALSFPVGKASGSVGQVVIPIREQATSVLTGPNPFYQTSSVEKQIAEALLETAAVNEMTLTEEPLDFWLDKDGNAVEVDVIFDDGNSSWLL